MKGLAKSLPEKERKFIKKDKVYRILSLQPSECWFGFIYTANVSDSEHAEELTPKLEGIEIYGSHSIEGSNLKVQLGPQSDDIIILKRNAGDVKFGLGSRISK